MHLRWDRIGTRSYFASFDEWPDGLEYVCGARAIVDSGEFYLQLGPHRLQPRYAPGWSVILAVPLALGVDPRGLVRVPALFDAAHALLLASVAFALAWRWAPPGPGCSASRRRASAALAGLVAGLGWCLTPVCVDRARRVLSDPASAFFCSLVLVLCLMSLLPRRGKLVDRPWPMLLAGLAAGLATAIRTANAALLLLPVAAIFIVLGLRRGWRAAGRAVAPAATGFFVVAGAVCWLVGRSGRSPLAWSGYELWVPDLYSALNVTFNWDYLLAGHPDFQMRMRETAATMGNLKANLGMLLGAPFAPGHGLGDYWPLLGWLSALGLAVWFWRRPPRDPRWGRIILLVGLAAWPLGHLVLYSLYFFVSYRFLIPVVAVAWVGLALGVALYLQRDRVAWRSVPLALAVLVFAFGGTIQGMQRVATPPAGRQHRQFVETERRFPQWLRLTDEQRRGREQGFNPLVAHALGWLGPDVVRGIGEWGLYDIEVEHVERMVRNGRMAPEETSKRDARRGAL